MTGALDVALATALELSEPDLDLEPLRDALTATGLRCSVLAWDDPRADFGSAAMTILRSTWNYPLRPAKFCEWVAETARISTLWNPAAVVRWNLHKRYLPELAAAGVAVAPTELVEQGSDRSLAEIADAREWSRLVVKPAVSASSMNTLAFSSGDLELGQAHLAKLAKSGDVLVQEYLSSVEGDGERALVWIDGELTHAVRKSPRFVGDEESTSAEAVPIRPDEARLAARALRAVSEASLGPLLYARVDVARDSDGAAVLMELELIEPSLYLSRSRRAFDRLVSAILARRSRMNEAG